MLLQNLGGLLGGGVLPGALPDLRPGDGLPRRLDVAAVGEEPAAVLGDDRQSGGGGETGGVEPVGAAGDQHGVDHAACRPACHGVQAEGVQPGGDLVKSAHVFHISFSQWP